VSLKAREATMNFIVAEEERFWRVIKLAPFRRTPGVYFDIIPMEFLPRVDGIDRVVHEHGAVSPGPVGEVARTWYYHPYQEDNLLVLSGQRTAEIYNLEYKRVETFIVTSDRVIHKGVVIYDGPCMLVWSTKVFHRITTGEHGSVSLNFAVRYPGFDIDTNFNIYDLDTVTSAFTLVKLGKMDQVPSI
jgi:hypothetical protein